MNTTAGNKARWRVAAAVKRGYLLLCASVLSQCLIAFGEDLPAVHWTGRRAWSEVLSNPKAFHKGLVALTGVIGIVDGRIGLYLSREDVALRRVEHSVTIVANDERLPPLLSKLNGVAVALIGEFNVTELIPPRVDYQIRLLGIEEFLVDSTARQFISVLLKAPAVESLATMTEEEVRTLTSWLKAQGDTLTPDAEFESTINQALADIEQRQLPARKRLAELLTTFEVRSRKALEDTMASLPDLQKISKYSLEKK